MNYIEKSHRSGRRWMLGALIIMFAFPIGMSFYLHASFNWSAYLSGVLQLSIIYLPVCVGEVLMYSQVLGTSATYLTFVTGNITNLKLPCVINALDIAEVEEGSEEAEVVSALASATSSIVTMLVVAIGVMLLIPLTPILQNPVLSPAFENIIPALFGSLGVLYLSKNVKVAIIPVVSMAILFFIAPGLGENIGVVIPISIVISLVSARILYKKGIV